MTTSGGLFPAKPSLLWEIEHRQQQIDRTAFPRYGTLFGEHTTAERVFSPTTPPRQAVSAYSPFAVDWGPQLVNRFSALPLRLGVDVPLS